MATQEQFIPDHITHTPEPWMLVEADNTIRAKAWGKSDQMGDYQGVIVCDLSPGIGGRKHAKSEALANAALIAAAPDMLAALQEIRTVLKEKEFIHMQASFVGSFVADKAFRAVDAAIAKATNTGGK